MLPYEIGACAWLEQVGSLRSPSQAHAPRPNTTEKGGNNGDGEIRAARAGLIVLARIFFRRRLSLVALSHLRYYFGAYFSHI